MVSQNSKICIIGIILKLLCSIVYVGIYNFMNYFDMWLTLLNENTEDNDSRYENHVFFTNPETS